MEIEVGEFARTTDGIIGIIENYDNGEYWIRHSDIDIWKCSEDYIVKHSKNIIDLLQEGDFANGYKIIWINYKDKWIMIQNIDEFGENGKKVLLENEIETILTKEQYQANCYTVERKEEKWDKD